MTELDRSPFPRDEMVLDHLPIFSLDRQLLRKKNIVGFNNRAIETRAFNLLRTTFAKNLKAEGYRVVGITSAAPDAGKSFLTVNLGASLSFVSDGPVFLVDLDLRRASLASSIGLEPGASVNDYLSGGESDLLQIGVRIKGSEVAVFPAARTRKPPVELLAGDRLADMMAALRSINETATVLVDLPPVFADDDAMIIAEHLDAYLLVVDAGKTTKNQVKQALAMMQPTSCIGTVINRYRGGLTDPYGYGYGYGAYQDYYEN
ncbi:MAG: CpsD/CapB family tyrosine-protein kinase [Erythrobacteraceae bacterium]|jgi:protein-tyrosine kinase